MDVKRRYYIEIENNTAAETQPVNTQPEENGIQSEKTFTQDEVNRIVSERLSRERAKAETPDNNDIAAREADLKRRENTFNCKEYLINEKLPQELLDVFSIDDIEKFKNNVEKIRPLLHDPNAPSQKSVRTCRRRKEVKYEY